MLLSRLQGGGKCIENSAHIFCTNCATNRVWSAQPTRRQPASDVDGDGGFVIAPARPRVHDPAVPARRPHSSLTAGAFYLPPCRNKVLLSDSTLAEPPSCAPGCRRCSPVSTEFVQSTHIPITADAATASFTADGLADWHGLQNAFQWHHCCFTCWKYRKHGQTSCPCRFKFPFALQDQSCFAVERSTQTGRCARSFRPRRNHAYLNATCPFVEVRSGAE